MAFQLFQIRIRNNMPNNNPKRSTAYSGEKKCPVKMQVIYVHILKYTPICPRNIYSHLPTEKFLSQFNLARFASR